MRTPVRGRLVRGRLAGGRLARGARTAALSALLCVLALGGRAAAESSSPAGGQYLRRFAIVMGANAGGEGRERLRYAISDARSFATVLTELGGVAEKDLILLSEPGVSAFRGAVRRVEDSATSATASGRRCELVFYYSGHSDEEGLLLGRDKLAYAELRAAIERVPADVRVAILDSCSSGSLTRAKGGSPRPAFLFDQSSDMKGHAYITSSSAAEAAQESDRIGGSFFTHYLVSALRGAADSSGEGRVTLNEAYAYAFRETLASTENTQFGPQHPNYEINLTGSGDLVFTDLRSAKASLLLSEELSGSMYVRDIKGNLAVELDKASGEAMELALPPGKYSVSMIEGGSRSQAEVLVSSGSKAGLRASDFRPVAAAPTDARGVAVNPNSRLSVLPNLEAETSAVGFPIHVGATLLPNLSRGLFSSDADRVVSLNLFWGEARDLHGFQFADLLNTASGDTHGVQFAGIANAVQGRAGGVQFAPFANVALGGFSGAQLFGCVNYAEGRGAGAQIGLVNIASHIAGAQIGLVNIADRIDGFPLGLVNIETGGISMLHAWTESGSSIHVGYAFGTRFVYTLVSTGFDISSSPQVPSIGLGLGGRLTIGPFFGNLDLSWRALYGVGGAFDAAHASSQLEMRFLAGFPVKGPGFLIGLALDGLMPALSLEGDGTPVSAFRTEPRFIAGFKL